MFMMQIATIFCAEADQSDLLLFENFRPNFVIDPNWLVMNRVSKLNKQENHRVNNSGTIDHRWPMLHPQDHVCGHSLKCVGGWQTQLPELVYKVSSIMNLCFGFGQDLSWRCWTVIFSFFRSQNFDLSSSDAWHHYLSVARFSGFCKRRKIPIS